MGLTFKNPSVADLLDFQRAFWSKVPLIEAYQKQESKALPCSSPIL